MAFDQINDYTFDFHCDACDEKITIEDDDLIEAAKELKSYGWLIKYNNGDYDHYCPDCK